MLRIRAIPYLRTAVEIDPNAKDAQAALAQALARSGKLDEAAPLFEKSGNLLELGELYESKPARLGRLVSQLLDLSRLESGALPLHRQRFPLSVLLEQAADESRLSHPDVDVHVSVDPHDLEVEADPERLHQVLANLLENAARHTPPGASTWWAITPIEPSSSRSRTRGRGSLRTNRCASSSGSTGPAAPRRRWRSQLGLSIAHWIVDLHHGSIRAETREPRGCRMVIELHVRDEQLSVPQFATN